MSAERRSLLPEEQSHRLAVELHQQGLFGVHEDPNDFITLKSGRIAPHYLDIRPGISSHVTRYMISNVMVVLSRLHNGLSEQARLSDTYDHIAGTPKR